MQLIMYSTPKLLNFSISAVIPLAPKNRKSSKIVEVSNCTLLDAMLILMARLLRFTLPTLVMEGRGELEPLEGLSPGGKGGILFSFNFFSSSVTGLFGLDIFIIDTVLKRNNHNREGRLAITNFSFKTDTNRREQRNERITLSSPFKIHTRRVVQEELREKEQVEKFVGLFINPFCAL